MSANNTTDPIPRFSRDALEAIANDLINKICPEILTKPQRTPLERITSFLNKEYEVSFNYDEDLGFDNLGRKIGGLCRFNPPEIFIDRDHFNEMRFHFTLAHEIGHFLLHRFIKLDQEEYKEGALVDTEIEWSTGKRKIKTNRQRMEWQANAFASGLLLPVDPFVRSIELIQYSMGINRNFGIIYLTDRSSIKDLRKIKNAASELFGVSETAIEVRLKILGRIIDKRKSNMDHLSQADPLGDINQ